MVSTSWAQTTARGRAPVDTSTGAVVACAGDPNGNSNRDRNVVANPRRVTQPGACRTSVCQTDPSLLGPPSLRAVARGTSSADRARSRGRYEPERGRIGRGVRPRMALGVGPSQHYIMYVMGVVRRTDRMAHGRGSCPKRSDQPQRVTYHNASTTMPGEILIAHAPVRGTRRDSPTSNPAGGPASRVRSGSRSRRSRTASPGAPRAPHADTSGSRSSRRIGTPSMKRA